MNIKHSYQIEIRWTGNTGSGTSHYSAYKRNHSVQAPNKPEILSSSDPAFRGDASRYNPEELFLAAISSCHMLWYLHLCANAGIIVIDYIDTVKGSMQETIGSTGKFTDVTLYPEVTVSASGMIDKAIELHQKANELCYIANSLNFSVHHIPVCKV